MWLRQSRSEWQAIIAGALAALVLVGGVGVFIVWDRDRWRDVTIYHVQLLDDQRSLSGSFSACSVNSRVDVDETAKTVRLRVQYRRPIAEEVCGGQFTVQLGAPLGNRAVIDAVSNRTLSVERPYGD